MTLCLEFPTGHFFIDVKYNKVVGFFDPKRDSLGVKQ